MTTSIPNDCIIPNIDLSNGKTVEASTPMSIDRANSNNNSSHNVSLHIKPNPLIRSFLPTLINANVQDFSDSNMDVDTDPDLVSRKRALPISVAEKQGKVKAKRPVNVENKNNTNLKDSLTDPGNSNNKILYTSSDRPPFIVHVYSFNEDPSVPPMHPLLISRTLSQIAYADIKEIKRIGRGKILAEMNSYTAANNLVLNPKLDKDNLRAFIPTYRIVRTGIVKDIPQHFEESDLLQFFDSPFKVVEVKRLNRRTKIDGEIKYIPSRTICLKFAGQILPKYVFLCRNRYEVSPYISKVKICFSCQRIGHISKNCKGKPRCLFCGGDKHDSPTSCPKSKDDPKCINCQGEHLATSYDCPLIIQHRKALSLAAAENIPIIEAKRKIAQTFSAPRDIIYDYDNFPLLNSGRATHNKNIYESGINNKRSSDIRTPDLSSQYNRFSILNTSPYSDGMPEDFSSRNTWYSGLHNNKKQSPSQSMNRAQINNNDGSRSSKSPQKTEKK